MKVVQKHLNVKDADIIEVIPISDWHIGDSNCNLCAIDEQVSYIKEHDNVFCVLNGDLCNNATKTSVSDIYSEKLTPLQQIQLVVEKLQPIKHKILAVTSGNHENRTYKKEGMNLSEIYVRELGLTDVYCSTGVLLFLSFGVSRRYKTASRKETPSTFVIYITHGSGGGKKEGSKVLALADLASIVDADIYIHAHTHLPMIMRENFFRVDVQHKSVKNVDKLFINSASTLNYGGYSEQFSMKPCSQNYPHIYLKCVEDVKYKSMYAKL